MNFKTILKIIILCVYMILSLVYLVIILPILILLIILIIITEIFWDRYVEARNKELNKKKNIDINPWIIIKFNAVDKVSNGIQNALKIVVYPSGFRNIIISTLT